MNKRGRKPPKHEPLICTGCGSPPHFRDGEIINPCACGSEWNVMLIEGARMPEWLEPLWQPPETDI